MVLESTVEFGGFNLNGDGVTKIVVHFAADQIDKVVQVPLLLDKNLELSVSAGDNEAVFEEVEFYSLNLNKDGEAKVIFRTFIPNPVSVVELTKFTDSEVDLKVEVIESEVMEVEGETEED